MMSRSGKGTLTAAPVASIPRRTVRRFNVMVMEVPTAKRGSGKVRLRCDSRERLAAHDVEDELAQLEPGRLERAGERVHDAGVHVALRMPHCVGVVLADQALCDRVTRRDGHAELARVRDRLLFEVSARIDEADA